MSDFLIVGGGVIGLMLARELAQTGAEITLVDRKLCAQESSWAGGGIVSPLYPWRYPEAVTQLATWSQSSYIHLADELLDETGYDPELRQKGMFMVDVEDQEDALAWAQKYHRPLRKVDADFLYQKEPNLVKGLEEALWMPEVCSIRNPRLGRSLRESLVRKPNVRLLEQQEVESFAQDANRIVGVNTKQGLVTGDKVVIAAGAWSADLLKLLGQEIPVKPVHGQMMLFKAKPGLVDRVVLKGGRYVIPRNDGRVLVGSTLEHFGFEKRTTQEAAASLHATALDIIPELDNYSVEHHWSGLRPGSPEGIPYIGAVPGYDNLFVNAGQYRNGLVLAPASTRLLVDLMLQRETIIPAEPYRFDR
ncbi:MULTISPECIES: glycine oxidase ThiO [unclassified Neptuniibacter]|uniref:glycine oxidase ThiO n=1 Tax=unclassified Neptuniibacter TaxID=2630693 RepID=UPI000C5DC632|nr:MULTISPECIES: glycine oxidase ThiO [unclassified Neptuniibacter]MAY42813.1 glycine oxidase ThiO [Oceanospirillaceae bacterium]|tara:strand:- start:5383 stop:6468 length:1086 start_codon:yes stop_codon:yes gene_type:complete